VIVVEVPSGRVLAMVSQPGYDPNRIDPNWERLTRNARTTPLLNRVTAGLYQPGGALQTIILAAILATNPDLQASGEVILNTEAPDARDPVQVDDLTLTCLDGTPDTSLTLAAAYLYGCPAHLPPRWIAVCLPIMSGSASICSACSTRPRWPDLRRCPPRLPSA